MGLRFQGVTREDVLTGAVGMQRRYGLRTNDSIIAACAVRVGADYLVTSDAALARVSALRVLVLQDIASSG